MKKLVLSAVLFASTSTMLFAANDVKNVDSKILAQEKIETSTNNSKEMGGVHITGTMTSSCGETWDVVYDCISDCTFMGTLQNMATIQEAINNACGTDTEEINLSFDQG